MTPRLPAGERLRRAGIAAWAIIGMLILAAIVVWVLVKISVIFPPLVLAAVIIYLLNPVVTKLADRGVPRVVGAIGTYIVVVGGITLVVLALIPLVQREIRALPDQWPQFRDRIVASVNTTAGSLNRRFGTSIDTTQVSCALGADETNTRGGPPAARCDAITKSLRSQVAHQTGRLTRIGFSVLEILLVFILAPLIALYLLIDLPRVQADLLALIPESRRAEVAAVGSSVGTIVGGFFRGQLLLAFIVGGLSAVGFKLIGLPFWLVVGVIAGIFNLIPVIGGFIGASVAFLIGMVGGGVGLAVKAALVELVVQQIHNHALNPYVMKAAVRLHPVTVMLSILAGGALAGFWGVLLAVPVVAVVKLLLLHLWVTRAAPQAGVPAASAPHVS